jgi:hypothetical protein
MSEQNQSNLAAALVKMQDACSYVYKGGRNQSQGYNYASAADVLRHVNAAACENSVASFPSADLLDCIQVPTRNGQTNLATVRVTMTLVHAPSGERLTVSALGQGADPGDKAVAKAQTMAIKYAWMLALNISTGDDPEADESTDRAHLDAPQSQGAPRQPTVHQNGSQRPRQEHSGNLLTEAQRGALVAIANKVFGRNSREEMAKLLDKPITQLSKSEASALIDRLRAMLPDHVASDAPQ